MYQGASRAKRNAVGPRLERGVRRLCWHALADSVQDVDRRLPKQSCAIARSRALVGTLPDHQAWRSLARLVRGCRRVCTRSGFHTADRRIGERETTNGTLTARQPAVRTVELVRRTMRPRVLRLRGDNFGSDTRCWKWEYRGRDSVGSGRGNRPCFQVGTWRIPVPKTPNVRVEAGPTVLRLAREAHHVPRRLAGQVQCRWASPPTRG
jgi:hypothetical protein